MNTTTLHNTDFIHAEDYSGEVDLPPEEEDDMFFSTYIDDLDEGPPPEGWIVNLIKGLLALIGIKL